MSSENLFIDPDSFFDAIFFADADDEDLDDEELLENLLGESDEDWEQDRTLYSSPEWAPSEEELELLFEEYLDRQMNRAPSALFCSL